MAALEETKSAIAPQSSVYRRAAVLLAISTSVVVCAAIAFSIWQSGHIAKDGVRNLTSLSVETSAGQLGPHLRFGNGDAVQLELDNHATIAGANFVSAQVWNAAGDVMGRVGETGAADFADLRATAMETGVAVTSGNGFTVAHPVIFDAEQGAIGVMVATWSPRATLNVLALQTLLSVLVIGMVFAGMTWFTVRKLKAGVGAPISDLEAAMERVAVGDYQSGIDGTDRGDEIGGIARSLDTLRLRLADAEAASQQRQAAQQQQQRVVTRLAEALQALAQGDLSQSIHEDLSEDYDRLRTDYNMAVDRMSDAIGQVVINVDSVGSGSKAISDSADDLARRTEEQAATLEETAAAVAELSTSVNETAASARDVENAVMETHRTAQSGADIVKSAQAAMSDIESSSAQVSQIVGLIDAIAFQTNLLALNAGVEAARAGDAGRGFAVVASEVRDLAQRAADAAKQIKELIEKSNDQVKNGVGLVEQTGSALDEISKKVSLVTERISGIAKGTVEQANGLNEINVAVSSLDSVTQANTAMVEETNAAAHTLASDTQRIAGLLSHFKVSGNGPGRIASRAA